MALVVLPSHLHHAWRTVNVRNTIPRSFKNIPSLSRPVDFQLTGAAPPRMVVALSQSEGGGPPSRSLTEMWFLTTHISHSSMTVTLMLKSLLLLGTVSTCISMLPKVQIGQWCRLRLAERRGHEMRFQIIKI